MRIPALAFMTPTSADSKDSRVEDYAPVRFAVASEHGARSWAKVNPDDGVLSTRQGPESLPAAVHVELLPCEGPKVVAELTVALKGSAWRQAAAQVAKSFKEPQGQLPREAQKLLRPCL